MITLDMFRKIQQYLGLLASINFLQAIMFEFHDGTYDVKVEIEESEPGPNETLIAEFRVRKTFRDKDIYKQGHVVYQGNQDIELARRISNELRLQKYSGDFLHEKKNLWEKILDLDSLSPEDGQELEAPANPLLSQETREKLKAPSEPLLIFAQLHPIESYKLDTKFLSEKGRLNLFMFGVLDDCAAYDLELNPQDIYNGLNDILKSLQRIQSSVFMPGINLTDPVASLNDLRVHFGFSRVPNIEIDGEVIKAPKERSIIPGFVDSIQSESDSEVEDRPNLRLSEEAFISLPAMQEVLERAFPIIKFAHYTANLVSIKKDDRYQMLKDLVSYSQKRRL